MKLSVIVPVYNVEKFLPRCLDSLLRQGLYAGEYEVIFVNNGSPDNCATILAEYEARYPDVFKVITQENKGLGCARNTGMKVASGEWITFVDSDDYLMVGAYKYLLEHFCKGNVDVVAYGYHCVYTDGVERPYAGGSLAGHIVYEEDGAEYYNNKDELPYVWSKLYRRMFLQEKIHLSRGYIVCFQLFSHHPRLLYTDYKAYGYEKNNATSQMHQSKKGIVLKQLNGLLYGVEYLNGYVGQETQMKSAALRGISIYLIIFIGKPSASVLHGKNGWSSF